MTDLVPLAPAQSCSKCGALVLPESMPKHDDWHGRQDLRNLLGPGAIR